jgi:PTH1 family peptidyl-tRNA hydrolase
LAAPAWWKRFAFLGGQVEMPEQTGMTEGSRDIRLVVGLGNPGKEYEGTRHNIGFAVLEQMGSPNDGPWKPARFAKAAIRPLGQETWLVKPLAFMNASGPVVADCLRWWKLEPRQLVVVVDDVALPTGRLRLRAQGSSGGHNGLRSIEQALGTQDYLRLRCGVGAKREHEDLSDHVLARFDRGEEDMVGNMKQHAVNVLEMLRNQGYEAAAALANKVEV